MAEILLEPSSLSKIIPLSFDLNDTNASNAAQLTTKRQFNTADTDAWFEVNLEGSVDTSGSFDITLFNLNDKSVFNHTGKPFTTNPFYYKLDSESDETTNEIRHAGRWIGQIVVTLANGNSATRKFIFDIEGHILDGADVQTILLEDYNALIAMINTSKDLLTQYNVDYAALLVDLAAAETARTNTYNQLVADQQANIDAFDVALDTGIVAANLATKLQTFEATNNSRLLSAEQQLAEVESRSNVFKFNGTKYIAHRGLMGIAPENSLPAYELAGQAGYWGAECDIYPTSDGQIVLMHDPTIDRTTNGTGDVATMTFAQLQTYNIDFGNKIADYPNLKVPTFEEYLEVCLKYNMKPVIEIQGWTAFTPEYAQKIVDTLRKARMEDEAIIICVFADWLTTMRACSDIITLGAILPYDVETVAFIKSLGNAFLDCSTTYATQENIDYCHANGIKMGVWGDMTDANRQIYLSRGVDYITTDYWIGG